MIEFTIVNYAQRQGRSNIKDQSPSQPDGFFWIELHRCSRLLDWRSHDFTLRHQISILQSDSPTRLFFYLIFPSFLSFRLSFQNVVWSLIFHFCFPNFPLSQVVNALAVTCVSTPSPPSPRQSIIDRHTSSCFPLHEHFGYRTPASRPYLQYLQYPMRSLQCFLFWSNEIRYSIICSECWRGGKGAWGRKDLRFRKGEESHNSYPRTHRTPRATRRGIR